MVKFEARGLYRFDIGQEGASQIERKRQGGKQQSQEEQHLTPADLGLCGHTAVMARKTPLWEAGSI